MDPYAEALDAYRRPAPTQAYGQWAQARGFQPQGYDINLGRSDDGKYAGFRTEGELKAAILGRSEQMRGQDRGQASELYSLADQYLNDLGDEYDTSMTGARDSLTKATGYDPTADAQRTLGSALNVFGGGDRKDNGFLGAAMAGVRKIPEMGYKQGVNKHETDLDNWLGDAVNPYLDALDTAAQIAQTPTRDYATIAGSEYGVDPNIVAGWYPEASQIKDYTDQREIAAINGFGLTNAGLERLTAQIAADQEQQTAADQQGYDDQTAAEIGYYTGMDADQLASQADLNTDQLYSLIQEPAYQELNGMLGSIVQSGDWQSDDDTDIRQAVDDALEQAATDPMMYRVLLAQWGGYGGAN